MWPSTHNISMDFLWNKWTQGFYKSLYNLHPQLLPSPQHPLFLSNKCSGHYQTSFAYSNDSSFASWASQMLFHHLSKHHLLLTNPSSNTRSQLKITSLGRPALAIFITLYSTYLFVIPLLHYPKTSKKAATRFILFVSLSLSQSLENIMFNKYLLKLC